MNQSTTSTIFQNWKGTEFFHYNHLNGTLVMIVNDGCIKGLYTRCDSQCANLARQFHRSMEYGVPPEKRLYDPCTIIEFHEQFSSVTEYLHNQSLESLTTSITI